MADEQPNNQRYAEIIKGFNWGNYGLNEVEMADADEWAVALADAVVAAVRKDLTADWHAATMACYRNGRRSVADDLRRRNALGQYDEAIRIAEGKPTQMPVGDLARIAEGNTNHG